MTNRLYNRVFSALICLFMMSAMSVNAKLVKMVKIKEGPYTPFFEKSKDGKKKQIIVSSFYLDITPVTNSQYLKFVKKNSEWRKSSVKDIFAENSYLRHWKSDLKITKKQRNEPVRNVSWFAAISYCESLGKELPTVLQWEYVASSDEKTAFALGKEEYKE